MGDLERDSTIEPILDMRRVLIVDDNLSNRFLMRLVIKGLFGEGNIRSVDGSGLYGGGVEAHLEGFFNGSYYSIAFVDDGYKAHKILVDRGHVNDIDFTLLDHNMPGPKGLEIIACLKQRGLPTRRIALYTDSECNNLKRNVAEHGALYYPKPRDTGLDAFTESLSFALTVLVPHYELPRDKVAYSPKDGHA